MVQASGQDAPWTPPWGGVLGLLIWEGSPRDTEERDYISHVPLEELVDVAEECSVWISPD